MKTVAALCLVLLTVLSATAGAQESAPAATTLVVSVDAGTSGLSADEVRAAIGTELGVATAAEGRSAATIVVRIAKGRALVSVSRASGTRIEREIDLPSERAAQIEVIALLAGNLARDEAAELLSALKKKEPATTTTEEKAPSAPSAAPSPAAKAPASTTTAVKPEAQPEAPATETTDAAPKAPYGGPLAANLSLFHPLSIVQGSERYTLNLELGLAYSRIGALSGYGLNIGHLRVDGRARGVATGVLWTRVDGDAEGAFMSGVFMQGGGTLRGAEVAGVVALRGGDVQGAQGAGAVAVADRVHGAQVAGAVAYAKGDVSGAQLSLVNVGGNVDGAQIGLVNVGGHVRGTQIGLVNVSDQVDGVPLGVVNVVAKGRTQALAWADTQLVANAAVKYLNGPVYTIVGAGWDGGDGAAPAFGIGAHVPLSTATYFELDGLYRYVTDFRDTDSDPDRHLSALRAVVGLQGLGPVGVFAGGGVAYEVESGGAESKTRPYGVAGVSLF